MKKNLLGSTFSLKLLIPSAILESYIVDEQLHYISALFVEASSNGPKFWHVAVLEKLSLHINFQPPECIPAPAIPSGWYDKFRFLSIFKNSYLEFQATNFNSATGIFLLFFKVSVKKYRTTLATVKSGSRSKIRQKSKF